VQVAALDAREFLAELIEQASPQTTRVDQDVVLMEQGEPATPRLSPLEGVTKYPFHTEGSIH
jgi:hypothetical protein